MLSGGPVGAAVAPETGAGSNKNSTLKIRSQNRLRYRRPQAMRRYLLEHGTRPGIIAQTPTVHNPSRLRDPEGNPHCFRATVTTKTGYAPASKQISTRLIHAGFVIKNLAAENRFYVDLLGFRLYWSAVSRMTAWTGTNSRSLTAPTR